MGTKSTRYKYFTASLMAVTLNRVTRLTMMYSQLLNIHYQIKENEIGGVCDNVGQKRHEFWWVNLWEQD